MKEKKIVLTFDYELFLAKSGTLENCVLKPTAALLNVLDEVNAKAIFFIDILYYQRCLELPETSNDAENFKNQIQTLLKFGHKIELHLHPHWIDAEYNGSQWIFNSFDNYKLQAFENERMEEIFDQGAQLLVEICQEVDPNYKITGFRAGGLCITPFNHLKNLFEKHSIKYDSSVAPGLASESKSQNYDFTKVKPSSKYHFSNDPCQENKNGSFAEYPINLYERTFIDKIKGKVFSKNLENCSIYGDGKGMAPRSNAKSSKLDFLKPLTYLYSLDGDFDYNLMERKMRRTHLPLITILSHPKLLSKRSFTAIRYLKKKGYNFELID